MKKVIFSFIIGMCAAGSVLAQTNDETAPQPQKKKVIVRSIHDFTDSVKYDRNLPLDSIKCAPDFPKVKSDDVTYSRRVWREVYFVESANRYLAAADPKKNIIRVILDEVRAGKMDGYASEKFDVPIDSASIDGSLNTLGIVSDEDFSDSEKNVKFGLRIMEDWFFDKNTSEFKPFIIGLAVLVPNTVNLNVGPTMPGDPLAGGGTGENLGNLLTNMQPIVWINYPSERERLCKYTVSHPNDNIKYSFDDVLQLRYFTSVITKESSPDDLRLKDRKELANGIDRLLEADRIKQSLIQYEQDLWEQ